MKYLIIPILDFLWCLAIFIVYAFYQIIHIFWHAEPRKDLISRLAGADYYYHSHRPSFKSLRFDYITHKINIKPKSLFEWYKWIFKYGPTGEVLEISEKEKYLYERYLEDQDENTKKS